ncbi:MAG TPA: 2-oxo acid dehydrogenase subunit E2, partial [Lacipirellulaceae bacterium]|nr:2-oxo acid dehydrogenase subunit E2 [Lacipirellulaceae bacterium]
MATQIKLPALGENIDSAGVLAILVSEGDVVEKDQDLLEVETDKATMPIPSPQAGKIVKVLVAEGESVPGGGPVFEIDGANGAAKADAPAEKEPAAAKEEAPAKKPAKATGGAKTPPPPPDPTPVVVEPDDEAEDAADDDDGDETDVDEEPAAPPARKAKAPRTRRVDSDDKVPGDGRAVSAAGPAVRRLARELGVELRRVRPSGEGGRITEDDVRNYVRQSQAEVEAKALKGVAPPGSPESDAFGGVRREKMSRMRQAIARNMTASYTTIPQLTNFDDVDLTELEQLRQDSADDYSARGIKLTTMPFLVKACAVALKHHPIVNASVSDEGDEILYKEYVNIGIAVDTERGLMVPVLRDADRK